MTKNKYLSTFGRLILFAGFVFGFLTILHSSPAYANHVCDPGTPREGQAIPHSPTGAEVFCQGGAGATPPAGGGSTDTSATDINETPVTLECRNEGDSCAISDHLTTFVRVLSAMVGIVVAIMIAWGGLQYTSSRDNPQQAAEAKNHILNAIIALVFYIFSIALLNWLVPGGVL